MCLVRVYVPCKSYRRRLRSLLLYLCYAFRALINSLGVDLYTVMDIIFLFLIINFFLFFKSSFFSVLNISSNGQVLCIPTKTLRHPQIRTLRKTCN